MPKQVIMIATSIANVNSSHYSLRTALCESIRYQAKSEQNVQQDLIPRERHVEAALMNPYLTWVTSHQIPIWSPKMGSAED